MHHRCLKEERALEVEKNICEVRVKRVLKVIDDKVAKVLGDENITNVRERYIAGW